MPFQILDIEGVANYLHLTTADIEQRVKNGEIPFEKRGGRIIFHKHEIDQWASQRIIGFSEQRLAAYHQKSSHHTRDFLPHEAILPEMLKAGALDSAMTSKTKASVLHDLVALAEKTEHVLDAKALFASLEAREDLCSTALPGGLALPHPRFQEAYMIDSSFIVVGRPVQEIHFGAPDGRPTHLFFLICCDDDRLHLHTLARLCFIARETDVLARLLEAPDALSMRDRLIAAEEEVLAARKPGA